MNNIKKYFIYVTELVLHITIETYVVNTVIFWNNCYCEIHTESPDGVTINEIVNTRTCIMNIHDVRTWANTWSLSYLWWARLAVTRQSCRSFVLCGQGSSLLWTPALRPYSGPVRLHREMKGIGRCVRCMLAKCRVKEGLSRSEQLVGYFYSAPLLDVAYCLA